MKKSFLRVSALLLALLLFSAVLVSCDLVTWGGDPVQYTVTFVGHDGTVLKTETVAKGGAATAPVAPDEIKFSDGLQKWLNYMQKQDSEKKEVNLTSEMRKIAGGVSGMLSGIESLGVELPQGLKDVMGGIQGMISIMTSISTILSAIEAINAAAPAAQEAAAAQGGGMY